MNILCKYLLEIEAIKLSPIDLFTWASGKKSPIYCDNRLTLSFPEVRNEICRQFASIIRAKYPNVETIAGVATGGIAHGALVAQALDLPFVYIRDKPKAHGRMNQIEGNLPNGTKAVVIEDLISTGGSSLKAVEALRESKAEVLGLIAIFTYGFEQSKKSFELSNCQLDTLTNFNELLDWLEKENYDKVKVDFMKNWIAEA